MKRMRFGGCVAGLALAGLILTDEGEAQAQTARKRPSSVTRPTRAATVSGRLLGRYRPRRLWHRRYRRRPRHGYGRKVGMVSLKGAPSIGSSRALVTIVFYSNFQCSYGTNFWNTYQRLRRQYPDMLRAYYRHHYIQRYQRYARLAAEAAQEAKRQGRFWDYAEVLWRNRWRLQRLSLVAYARELGLNMKAFTRALDRGTHRDRVSKEIALSRKEIKTTSCPMAWVNGRLYYGYRVSSGIYNAINQVKRLNIRPLP